MKKDKKLIVEVSVQFEYNKSDYLDNSGELDEDELNEKILYDLSDLANDEDINYYTVNIKEHDCFIG